MAVDAAGTNAVWQWIVGVETAALGALLLILIRQMLGSEKRRAEKFDEIFRRLVAIEKREDRVEDISHDVAKIKDEELEKIKEHANLLQRNFEVCREGEKHDASEIKAKYQATYDLTYKLRHEITTWKVEVDKWKYTIDQALFSILEKLKKN